MTDWNRRTVYIERVEYYLPNPTDWIEVSKMISAIDDDLSAQKLPTSDNSVKVRADDEEIVFWWEAVTQVTP